MPDAVGQFVANLLLATFYTPAGLIIPAVLLVYAGFRIVTGVRQPAERVPHNTEPRGFLRRRLPRWIPLLVGVAILAGTVYVCYLFSQGGFPAPDLSHFQG